VAHRQPIEKRVDRFVLGPTSVRNAANFIVVATALVVVLGGVLMRVLDGKEYPSVWRGFWWAMQTVTTVGYGDVTPAKTSGRIVASVVMLWGIAFVAILVAGVTSTFVARATRERLRRAAQEEEQEDQKIEAQLGDLAARLDRIEQTLSRLAR
jgi:voltage-gated potassium channel Kch